MSVQATSTMTRLNVINEDDTSCVVILEHGGSEHQVDGWPGAACVRGWGARPRTRAGVPRSQSLLVTQAPGTVFVAPACRVGNQDTWQIFVDRSLRAGTCEADLIAQTPSDALRKKLAKSVDLQALALAEPRKKHDGRDHPPHAALRWFAAKHERGGPPAARHATPILPGDRVQRQPWLRAPKQHSKLPNRRRARHRVGERCVPFALPAEQTKRTRHPRTGRR